METSPGAVTHSGLPTGRTKIKAPPTGGAFVFLILGEWELPKLTSIGISFVTSHNDDASENGKHVAVDPLVHLDSVTHHTLSVTLRKTVTDSP